MVDDNELNALRGLRIPSPDPQAKIGAMHAALRAFDEAQEKIAGAPQGSAGPERLTSRASRLWREIMNRKLYAAPGIASLIAVPIAGVTALYLVDRQAFDLTGQSSVSETAKPVASQPVAKPEQVPVMPSADGRGEAGVGSRSLDDALNQPGAPAAMMGNDASGRVPADVLAREAEPAPLPATGARTRDLASSKLYAPQALAPASSDAAQPRQDGDNRLETFKSNAVHSVQSDPVSTFSIDVDTASYSFVRRSLKEGVLPQPDTVRVEEMINYFPYDWTGPDSAATPFNSTVTVMPAPWNAQHKLMHVAIKGYDMQPATEPKANLVFLIDVSGSMDEPDKLPLLKSAFRLLVNKLRPDDTVSIVTYAGNAGTVLTPTKASEKDKIIDAIDSLTPGGTTAGEQGIREAYRLAGQSFVKGGVNRVMLATDGDFNVGQTDDADLKRLIEQERKSGVYLSVLGFGADNLNDRMMQAIAQNGNGTAAYIDTLSEAEKALVQEASSTLFPIAKDVKIQVEFNPATVAEYRLIGYETRALNREDFNNDRVDAGDIGAGHAVTAIYEITPKGSGGEQMDPLRYGQASTANGGVSNADEYAFVKIRYKLPDENVSKLITTPVTKANEVASFDKAGTDQRFSVAVAAFGQKLRDEDATADFGYDRIAEIATAARGADPYGYRSEFLSLVRLASALSANR